MRAPEEWAALARQLHYRFGLSTYDGRIFQESQAGRSRIEETSDFCGELLSPSIAWQIKTRCG